MWACFPAVEMSSKDLTLKIHFGGWKDWGGGGGGGGGHTQNHILEPFSGRRVCTQCYITWNRTPDRRKFGVKICGKLERKLS